MMIQIIVHAFIENGQVGVVDLTTLTSKTRLMWLGSGIKWALKGRKLLSRMTGRSKEKHERHTSTQYGLNGRPTSAEARGVGRLFPMSVSHRRELWALVIPPPGSDHRHYWRRHLFYLDLGTPCKIYLFSEHFSHFDAPHHLGKIINLIYDTPTDFDFICEHVPNIYADELAQRLSLI